ncbi:unnamed protein product [Adineta steineri]|uniref:SCP domain-containing protein n=1 Tax=Adineta steineri TaxID=433720 RepID=A0A815FL02_9BILA|nr:unnamed protein product [Adineta steineri]CAF1328234.1 unnamed protein product [Adineta steineri]
MHNQERFDVNAIDMQKMYWNVDLAEIAQRYCKDFKIKFSKRKEITFLFLADHCNFDHDKSNQHGIVGHYTQMVKNTAVLIGCGLAICPKNCHGLICLYGGTIDLNLCQCQCQSYTSGKQCENLDCSSLQDDCQYGTDQSLCAIYSNIPIECPKFCGLCNRYDAMKKYYNSLEISKNNGIETIRNISVFIQIIIVLLYFS